MDERKVKVKPDNEYIVEKMITGIPLPKHEFNIVGTIVGSVPPEETAAKLGILIQRYLVRFEGSTVLYSFKPEDLIFEVPSEASPISFLQESV